MVIKHFTYTKDNGETSKRSVVVISKPRKDYLMYDVTSFNEGELKTLEHYLDSIEEYRNETIAEFEDITGIKQSTLWRSFKPEGIEWDKGSEI